MDEGDVALRGADAARGLVRRLGRLAQPALVLEEGGAERSVGAQS